MIQTFEKVLKLYSSASMSFMQIFGPFVVFYNLNTAINGGRSVTQDETIKILAGNQSVILNKLKILETNQEQGHQFVNVVANKVNHLSSVLHSSQQTDQLNPLNYIKYTPEALKCAENIRQDPLFYGCVTVIFIGGVLLCTYLIVATKNMQKTAENKEAIKKEDVKKENQSDNPSISKSEGEIIGTSSNNLSSEIEKEESTDL